MRVDAALIVIEPHLDAAQTNNENQSIYQYLRRQLMHDSFQLLNIAQSLQIAIYKYHCPLTELSNELTDQIHHRHEQNSMQFDFLFVFCILYLGFFCFAVFVSVFVLVFLCAFFWFLCMFKIKI
jgi:hypothetical protein